jgi:hypothetical protein
MMPTMPAVIGARRATTLLAMWIIVNSLFSSAADHRRGNPGQRIEPVQQLREHEQLVHPHVAALVVRELVKEHRPHHAFLEARDGRGDDDGRRGQAAQRRS